MLYNEVFINPYIICAEQNIICPLCEIAKQNTSQSPDIRIHALENPQNKTPDDSEYPLKTDGANSHFENENEVNETLSYPKHPR